MHMFLCYMSVCFRVCVFVHFYTGILLFCFFVFWGVYVYIDVHHYVCSVSANEPRFQVCVSVCLCLSLRLRLRLRVSVFAFASAFGLCLDQFEYVFNNYLL